MELIEHTVGKSPDYLKMSYDCLNKDCSTWYTQEAQFSFARYLNEKNKTSATFDDLLNWKKMVKIG